MSPRILAAGMSAAMAAGILASGYAADSALARPVSLADATAAPSWLRYVQPHRNATVPYRCAVNASDVSAYHWNGRALSDQRWTADRLTTFWETRNRRRITFDGITFHNGARVPVLVAIWC